MKKKCITTIVCILFYTSIIQLKPIAQNNKWLNISATEFINAIIEEGDTLWIATDGGLVRWDKRTESPFFYTKSGQGALMTSIQEIAIDKDRTKWLASANIGLVKWTGSDLELINLYQNDWRDNHLINVSVDMHNNIWATTVSSKLVKVDTEKNITFYQVPDFRTITSLVVDSNNIKWVGTTTGLLKFDGEFSGISSNNDALLSGENIERLGLGKNGALYIGTVTKGYRKGALIKLDATDCIRYEVPYEGVYCMHVGSDGVVTVGGSSRIAIFDGEKFTSVYSIDKPRFSCIMKDQTDNIWYGINHQYFMTRFAANGSETQYDIRNSDLNANKVKHIQIENNGTAWIASTSSNNRSGLNSLNKGMMKIFNYYNVHDLTYEINSLFIDSKSTKWIGGLKGYISDFKENNITHHHKNGSDIRGINEDTNGALWFNNGGSLTKFENEKWQMSGFPNPLGGPILHFDIDKRDRIWAGTNRGLYVKDGSSWTRHGGYLTDYHHVHIDVNDKKWLLTHHGVEVYNGESFIEYTADNSGLPDNMVTAVTTDKNGVAWFGCDGGYLVRFDGIEWKIYNPVNSGIPSFRILSLAIDEKENIWVGTTNGLAIFNENGVDIKSPLPPYVLNDNSILSPKINEPGTACTTATIRLKKTLNDKASLWFSPDNGASWNIVEYVFDGHTTYTWNVPAANSNQCKLRLITETTNDTIETTGLFSINYQVGKFISITSPQMDEVWGKGESNVIEWESFDVSGKIRLSYSTNHFRLWRIINDVENTGSYNWRVSETSGNELLIRVSDVATRCIIDTRRVKTSILTNFTDILNKTSDVAIQPNPSQGKFLYLSHSKEEISLVDMFGRPVTFEKKTLDDGSILVELSESVKGILLLRQGGECHKIVIDDLN